MPSRRIIQIKQFKAQSSKLKAQKRARGFPKKNEEDLHHP